MLKVLLKKQLAEVFRGYFFDAKKNKARSKAAVIGWFVFFAVIMIGVLGGMFTFLSLTLCGTLTLAGMDWLYMLLFSGISILLGAFGSVFNTFSGLYLAKDNDLLLSMPIPVQNIIISRLMNVYIMGSIYSAVVILPALIVYWVIAGLSAARLLCGLLLMLMISAVVLVLSCLLGWCVAKLSTKLKRKSFTTVAASLAFIGLYYFFYFKAQDLVSNLVQNMEFFGEKIKGAAYGLYIFGRAGTGEIVPALLSLAVCLLLLLATWFILKKTFLSIATFSGGSAKARYKEKTVKEKSPFRALLGKEFKKLGSSANYMLNCGLGVLFIPVLGVVLLVKGKGMLAALEGVFGAESGIIFLFFCAAVLMASSMIDTAAPAVSLEGRSIWIPQSLPVEPKTVLRAKWAVQVILSLIPTVFTVICGLIVLRGSWEIKLLSAIFCFIFPFFMSAVNSFVGIKMPNLSWTNELVPIKQSAATAIAIFGVWIIAVAFAGIYFLIDHFTPCNVSLYLGGWILLLAAVTWILLRWLDSKGAKRFAEL